MTQWVQTGTQWMQSSPQWAQDVVAPSGSTDWVQTTIQWVQSNPQWVQNVSGSGAGATPIPAVGGFIGKQPRNVEPEPDYKALRAKRRAAAEAELVRLDEQKREAERIVRELLERQKAKERAANPVTLTEDLASTILSLPPIEIEDGADEQAIIELILQQQAEVDRLVLALVIAIANDNGIDLDEVA